MSEKPTSPIVMIIGGPNGAGKSTCADGQLRTVFKDIDFINADMIARGLSASRPESVAIEAGRIMITRMHLLAAQGANFALEATLSGRFHAQLLRRMKSDGYFIDLRYISLPHPDLCVERVARRVEAGGHDISESDIRRRYFRSLKNLFNLYIPLADQWRIYDNSGEEHALIAESNHHGQAVILDEDNYAILKQHAKV